MLVKIYCSTYCNQGHCLNTGRPVNHACVVIPPEALAAERRDNFDLAIDIITKASPLKPHRGLKYEES